MKYDIRLSDRAAKDLDRLDRVSRQRVIGRLEQLSEDPFDPRFSLPLSNAGSLRRSRIGGWRIIFSANTSGKALEIVTVERRGQVYGRI